MRAHPGGGRDDARGEAGAGAAQVSLSPDLVWSSQMPVRAGAAVLGVGHDAVVGAGAGAVAAEHLG
jgi:hypothetical protein